jgi:hypothetical protein
MVRLQMVAKTLSRQYDTLGLGNGIKKQRGLLICELRELREFARMGGGVG